MSNTAYTVLLEYFKDEDAEGYNAMFSALPEIVTWDRTLDEAETNAREALACHLQGLFKDGEQLPPDIAVDEPVRRELCPLR